MKGADLVLGIMVSNISAGFQFEVANMRFCVVGLGYVGLTLAVHLTKKGSYVEGVDRSDKVIDALKNGRSHFYENQFDEELSGALKTGRFVFGKEIKKCTEKRVFIVTVGTPMGKGGRVNLDSIRAVSKEISSVLWNEDIVVLRSTVKVGVTRDIVKPILDATGVNYYLGFCPERTIEGKALEELNTLPQIVAGVDAESCGKVADVFSSFSNEIIILNSVEEAELVKLLNNSERDMMFALANEVALMCDAKGLDAHKVIAAANYKYPRSNLKQPGPVGGPCLEKDPYILTEGFQEESYVPSLFLMGRKVNERIMADAFVAFANIYQSRMNRQPQQITVLGFAFKGMPITGDMRGSPVYMLVDEIRKRFPSARLIGHDYLADRADIEHAQCEPKDEVESAVANADMVILQNNHPSYSLERWHEIIPEDALILDFWNQLSDNDIIDQDRYFRFGAMAATPPRD